MSTYPITLFCSVCLVPHPTPSLTDLATSVSCQTGPLVTSVGQMIWQSSSSPMLHTLPWEACRYGCAVLCHVDISWNEGCVTFLVAGNPVLVFLTPNPSHGHEQRSWQELLGSNADNLFNQSSVLNCCLIYLIYCNCLNEKDTYVILSSFSNSRLFEMQKAPRF